MDTNIRSNLTDDGILTAWIDMPGRSMNVFSLDMMDSLERLLDFVESNSSVRAVVLTSGKQAFIAGADLDMILGLFTERAQTDTFEELHDLCGRLGRLFRRLERSSKPYVAAINGLALGGGLELCLACHARIVADSKAVMLGLPEIKLGLLPGAGGTQRLPRIVGARLGMDMLLKGYPVSPAQALECGMVTQVVSPENLIEAAMECARTITNTVAPWDHEGSKFSSAPFDFGRDRIDAYHEIAEAIGLSDAVLAKYPAYKAIIDCVVGGWNKPMDEACHWEMDCFVHLIKDPVAGNMVRTLFINRQRAAKLVPTALDPRKTRVAVAGTNSEALVHQLASARIEIVPPDQLTGSDIALLLPGGKVEQGIRIAWIAGTGSCELSQHAQADAAVWLSETTAHGSALEVVVPQAVSLAADAGIVLGQKLRAMVLITTGKSSLLCRLASVQLRARQAGMSEQEELLAVAFCAANAWAEGGIADVALADVAAVLAGLHPAYTGGPFNFLRQCGLADLSSKANIFAARDPELFHLPDCLPALIKSLSKES